MVGEPLLVVGLALISPHFQALVGARTNSATAIVTTRHAHQLLVANEVSRLMRLAFGAACFGSVGGFQGSPPQKASAMCPTRISTRSATCCLASADRSNVESVRVTASMSLAERHDKSCAAISSIAL